MGQDTQQRRGCLLGNLGISPKFPILFVERPYAEDKDCRLQICITPHCSLRWYFLAHDQDICDERFLLSMEMLLSLSWLTEMSRREMSGEEIFEIEMWRKCVSQMGILGKENGRKMFRWGRGKGKSLLTLIHKCFWTLFLSTGKH